MSRHARGMVAVMLEHAQSAGSPVPLDRERDRPHPLQLQAWRAMGAAERTRFGIELRRKARHWKRAALRAQHPDWSEERLQTELAKIYRGGRS